MLKHLHSQNDSTHGVMIMKSKSIFLLLIFLGNLIPMNDVSANTEIRRSFDDALSLLYFSEAILENQTDLDQVQSTPNLFAINYNALPVDPDNAALAAAIHAAKTKRNNLDADCNLTISQYRAQGKDCEADRIKETCDQKRSEINAEIGRLHKKRGDRRRPLTKFWHGLKRTGKSFWYRIGSRGRNFLRQVGPEALEIVATSGFSGLKTFVKSYIKSVGRKKFILRGLEAILEGQLELMQAAGLDVCDPEKEEEQAEKPKPTKTEEMQVLKDGATWRCEDIDGRISAAKAMNDVDAKHLQGKLDLSIIYNEDGQVLDITYAVHNTWEFGVWQEDGSLGQWHEVSSSFNFEDTAVDFSDETGFFQVKFIGEERRTDSLLGYDGTVPYETNIFGIIPAEDWKTAYVCDFGANQIPPLAGTLTAENFLTYCIHWYYECPISSK